jgi:hypothetical protein
MSGTPEADHELDQPLADELTGRRPTPRASFRGALGRYLTDVDPGYGARPARLRALVAAYMLAGLLLLLGGLALALATA